MEKILENRLNELKKLNFQRKAWLGLSFFVMISISFIIFDTKDLINYGLVWPFAILGIIVSAVWWYWTMLVVRKIIEHKKEETELLIELVNTIKEIRKYVFTAFK